jgi:hypothetical protein
LALAGHEVGTTTLALSCHEVGTTMR